MSPAKVVGLVVALLVVLVGALWTGQGLGYLGDGTAATESSTGSVLGPIVAGLGVALAIVVLQRRGH